VSEQLDAHEIRARCRESAQKEKRKGTVALQSKCNNLEAQLVAANIPDAQNPKDEEIYRALQNPKTFKNLKSFKRVQDL